MSHFYCKPESWVDIGQPYTGTIAALKNFFCYLSSPDTAAKDVGIDRMGVDDVFF